MSRRLKPHEPADPAAGSDRLSVAGPRFPAGLLSPVVCPADDLPDDGAFGVGVGVPVEPVPFGEAALGRLVIGSRLPVGAKEVAEQQGKLLGEAAGPPDVDVCSRAPWRFAEVPLGALGVIGPVDEAESLQRYAERLDRLQPADRDLDVDHGLGAESGNRGRANMVDADRHAAECVTQPATEFRETVRPCGVVIRDANYPFAGSAGAGEFQVGSNGVFTVAVTLPDSDPGELGRGRPASV